MTDTAIASLDIAIGDAVTVAGSDTVGTVTEVGYHGFKAGKVRVKRPSPEGGYMQHWVKVGKVTVVGETAAHGNDATSGDGGKDVRTVSAAEAAQDSALWEAVKRGEVEVRDTNFGRDIALEGFMGSRSDDASRLLFDYHGFPVELWTGNALTVRRLTQVAPDGNYPRDTPVPEWMEREYAADMELAAYRAQPPAGDGVLQQRAKEAVWQAVLGDVPEHEKATTIELNTVLLKALEVANAQEQELRTQLADANARAEKAEAQNAMYKHIADNASDMYYLERENSRLLYRTLAASAPDALLAVRDKLNQAGTERDKVSSEMQRRIHKAVMALLNEDTATALAALRGEQEADSAEASK